MTDNQPEPTGSDHLDDLFAGVRLSLAAASALAVYLSPTENSEQDVTDALNHLEHLSDAQRLRIERAAQALASNLRRNRRANCPVCDAHKHAHQHLCRSCWGLVPEEMRRNLTRKDDLAGVRRLQFDGQLEDGVPLAELRISP